jgi:hypothetical protein
MAMQRGLRRVACGSFGGAVTVAFRLVGRYHKVSVYAASIANGGAGLRDSSG